MVLESNYSLENFDPEVLRDDEFFAELEYEEEYYGYFYTDEEFIPGDSIFGNNIHSF